MLEDRDALRPAILAALDTIKDPCSLAAGTPFGLAEMGIVDTVDISDDGAVTVKLRLTSPFCHMIGFFETEAATRIGAIEGVTSVALKADNGLDWSPSRISQAAQARRQHHLDRMAAHN